MDKSYAAFYDAYRELAKQGKCDTSKGEEFKRVLAEWETGGLQAAVREFIVRRANAVPHTHEHKPKAEKPVPATK